MVIYDKYIADSGAERVKAYSDKNVMIERDGALYSEADDFAYQQRVYTETDISIDPQPETDIQQKSEVSNYLTENNNNNNNIKTQELNNKIIDIYNKIENWVNPKENQKPYNKGDKCYYKNEYWVSTVDNNISKPDSLANTWINI